MEAVLAETEVQAPLDDAPLTPTITDTSARTRADYVRTILTHLANRNRLRILTTLYNAPSGLELGALAAMVEDEPDMVKPLADRLAKANLVTEMPVLDDESLGWTTRYALAPSGRAWLERVAIANGREAIVPA